MDTRTLGTKTVEDGVAIIDQDSDNLDTIGVVALTGDEDFDATDRVALAKEMTKRFNLYPRLIAFIQHAGNIVDGAELEDFFCNNYEDVMEDKEGNSIEEDIPFIGNEQIFKD